MSDKLIDIVDDDDAVRSSLRLLLKSCGWRTRTFGSAGEFLGNLAEEFPDCLLLDLNMPGMNGAELLENLAGQCRQVPVIVMTGHPDSQLVTRARLAGARVILHKPFDAEVLTAFIERISSPAQGSPASGAST